jgi:hypothetical protein
MTTGLERVARKVYVAAQDYTFFKSRELKTQGKADRALNYVLGFNSHDDRLAYLQLQMSGQLAIKGQTLQGVVADRENGRDKMFYFMPTTKEMQWMGLSKVEDILMGIGNHPWEYFTEPDPNLFPLTTRGIQPGRSHTIAAREMGLDRILFGKETGALQEWYSRILGQLSRHKENKYFDLTPYKPQIKTFNITDWAKFNADEVMVKAFRNGRIDTSIFYRPMPSGLVHTHGLI